MRPFEGFSNKIAVPAFTRDASYHTVTLTGIQEDAVLLTIEIHTPTLANVGVRPTGSIHGAGVTNQTLAANSTATTIMRVNSAKQMEFKSNQADTTFSITGAWGGMGVFAFQPTFPIATGWTTGNSMSFRDFDFSTLCGPWLPESFCGHIEAVICFLRTGTGSNADARGNGSTWQLATAPVGVKKLDTIVPVDADDIIEVYEGDNGAKPTALQNSWVYFVGYILKGAYVNFDDEKFYRYKAILNPQDDEIGNYAAWDTYNAASKTVGKNVKGIYWRMQFTGTVAAQPLYAREVGSTDTVLLASHNQNFIPGFPLNVDEDGNVEFNIIGPPAPAESWIFGYVEEVEHRRRAMIMVK